MICPVCKKDALVVEYQNIELDYCPVCRGVWFDAGEIETLIETAGLGQNQYLQDLSNAPEARVPEKKHRCPICLKKMTKQYADAEKKIIVDVCRGHGIWFDGGEVNALIKTLAEKSADKAEAVRVLGFVSDMFKYQV